MTTNGGIRDLSRPAAQGGEMGQLTRQFDWGKTPVGPIESWPVSLQTTVQTMLGSRYAMWVGWGPEFTFFYNDAYARVTLGPKHPWALGRPCREVWSEIWNEVGPRAESVIRTGEATWDEGLLLFLQRNGFPEETYHTFSYSPVPDDQGGIGGMLCVVTEDTRRTIGERRLKTLRELAAGTSTGSRSAEEACQVTVGILKGNPYDVPFAFLYLLSADGTQAELAGVAGLSDDHGGVERSISFDGGDSPWPFAEAARAGDSQVVRPLPAVLLDPGKPIGIWPEPPQAAVVLPLARPGQSQLAGFLVAGLSPRLLFDDDYRGFLDLLAGQVATAIAAARAYEEERRRAEALAALDRAKTAFFSNVSHEFRTPLTLMRGPVEDLLAGDQGPLPAHVDEQLRMVHRNSLRLLRLVNSILDFSRIEAGRVQARFEPTDLVRLTADLASTFRSTYERAGLKLHVRCSSLPRAVYVDREMWEKIVLNLLSNAFKFTLNGEVEIVVESGGSDGEAPHAELRVRDTGIGIAPEELPRLFERFHRIENSGGRTHEGSGIGLALVQELVRLHGGQIRAESVVGLGTTFVVSIPYGTGHLPADQLAEPRSEPLTGERENPFVEEANRWLAGEPRSAEASTRLSGDSLGEIATNKFVSQVGGKRPLVLVADDNADMREYVGRLLSEHYRVKAVGDGEAALKFVEQERPDLVLTDVMMPRLDGFGLLKRLRADARMEQTPIIMLSARAGEESRVEGMDAGADDYLVKPFSARELLARVGGHLQIARVRREASDRIRKSEEQLRRALSAARMVAWEWNPATDSLAVSANARELFGVRPEDPVDRGAYGAALMVPQDLPGHQAIVASAIERRGSYFSQYRMRRADDGRTMWLEERGHAEASGEGDTEELRVVGVTIDVTERRTAELALEQEREWFRVTLSSIGDAVITADMEGRVTFLNQVAASLTGWSLEDAMGLPLTEVFHIINENSRLVVENPVEKVLRSGLIVGLANHTLLIDRSGTERPIDDSAAPIRDADGHVIGVVLIFRDVSEQRGTERKIRESELRYRLIGDAANDAIWDWDLRTDQVVWNEGVQTHFGYKAEEVAPTALWWYEHIHPEDRVRIVRGIHERIDSGGKDWSAEYRFLHADGSGVHVSDRGQIVHDESGRAVRMVGSMLDLTERRRGDEDRFRLAAIVESSDDAIISKDLQGIITTWNRGAERLFGYTAQEAVGRSVTILIPPERNNEEPGILDRIRRGEPIDHYETIRRRKDGTLLNVSLTVSPLRDSEGRVVGASKIARDITERKRTEDALREADRRKNEFLATLAHELRNPLAPIRMGLELMELAGDDRETVVEVRRTLEGQTQHLIRLVDDLLDISRITSGKVVLKKERVELSDIVRSAVEATRSLFSESGHELVLSLPADPVSLEADPTRLVQVLTNLLTNAARYSPDRGTVTLTATVEGEELRILVRDTGIGIPDDMLERIFDMFEQVDRSLERTRSGLGIGLTLVRRLVELHGGTVTAHSEGPNRGSEFRLRLPIVASGAQETFTVTRHPPAARSLRVLIVDDNRDAARMLSMVVSHLQHDVRIASDGLEAIQVAGEFRPQVVLMDIGMPVLNGYEAAGRLRSLPWGREILLVALTGWGQAEDRKRSQEAGFDQHLVKPVDPQVLQRLLEEAAR